MSRVIVHLSDLHFGRVDPATLEPLVKSIAEVQPDVVAISGDLTQRARRHEFAEARDFVDRLPKPRIVVPGNHDVPLDNPYLRFVAKWSRFREYIEAEIEPSFVTEDLAVIGVNTGRALTWKGGRISGGQIESVRQCFCAAAPTALKVLVVHHPMDLPEGWARANQTMRAAKALARWEECGVDLILAGHAHRAFAGTGKYRAVIAQAGTATSTRGRGEPNSFNVIYVDAGEFTILRQTWQSGEGRFVVTEESRFQRS